MRGGSPRRPSDTTSDLSFDVPAARPLEVYAARMGQERGADRVAIGYDVGTGSLLSGVGMDEDTEHPGGTRTIAYSLPVDLDDLCAEDVDPLIAVTGLAFVVDEVQQDIARLVRYCRSSGKTWTQIGHALGVSKQAAWERYSGED
jgi:hypothetical protein